MKKKNEQREFDIEIQRILTTIYNEIRQHDIVGVDHVKINTKQQCIDFLIEYELIKPISRNIEGDSWELILSWKGFEVFEKYKDWYDYKKRKIDNKEKFENYKRLAAKYWWLPIAISLLALIVSAIALFVN